MKKLLLISLSALLAISLGACTAPQTPSSCTLYPPPESIESSSTEQEPKPPPIPADTAIYRGTVTAISCIKTLDSGSKTIVTLEQYEGSDYGAPTLQFDFTEDTRADFAPEHGQYLEVYYGVVPQQPLDVDAVHDAITAIKHPSADMVNYNGVIKAIIPRADRPSEGSLVMIPFGVELNETYSSELPADGEPYMGNPETHFNYNKDETHFYLNLDELKVGDKLNIFYNGISTRSIPPQSFAGEVRRYAEPVPQPTPTELYVS